MTQADKAVSAIRAIDVIDCDQLRDLFNVIAAKMKEADFADIDLDMVDEMNGFICGEETPAPTCHRYQCAEEGAIQRFEGWMREMSGASL